MARVDFGVLKYKPKCLFLSTCFYAWSFFVSNKYFRSAILLYKSDVVSRPRLSTTGNVSDAY